MIKIVKSQKKLSVPTERCTLDEAKRIVPKLRIALTKFGGVGIAANQLGINKSVFATFHNKVFKWYLNPEIVETGDEITQSTEGCLSFPNVYVTLPRFNEIKIKADNLEDEITLTGYEAFIFQHEKDHLNGVTILSN